MSLKIINTQHSEAVLYRTENLERYLKEINKEENLTREQERHYLIQAQQGNQKAIEKLTKANLKFVVSCAKEYQKRGFELVDLIQAGNEGLVDAIKKFDLEKEVKFISYAVWRIKAKIIEFIRSNISLIILPLNRQNELTKLNKVKDDLDNKYESNLTYGQILGVCEDINLKFDYIKDAVDCSQEFSSLDSILPGNEDFCLAQIYPCKDPILCENKMFNEERKVILYNVLKTLPELQQKVLSLSFGLEDGIVRTNEDIAMYLKKTPENIRQIKIKSLKTLKNYKILEELL